MGEAAGQSNTTVVSYHFGSKTALVRAIMTKHGTLVDSSADGTWQTSARATTCRDWARCLVHPVTEHLDTLGVPSWQARFAVQVLTDPLMRALVTDESLTRDSLRQTPARPGQVSGTPGDCRGAPRARRHGPSPDHPHVRRA
ncbi:hypothetical protein [Streptomyces canarius]